MPPFECQPPWDRGVLLWRPPLLLPALPRSGLLGPLTCALHAGSCSAAPPSPGNSGWWGYFKFGSVPALPLGFATGHLPPPVRPGMLTGSWPGWGLGTDCYKTGCT